jgi:hypothetical protein
VKARRSAMPACRPRRALRVPALTPRRCRSQRRARPGVCRIAPLRGARNRRGSCPSVTRSATAFIRQDQVHDEVVPPSQRLVAVLEVHVQDRVDVSGAHCDGGSVGRCVFLGSATPSSDELEARSGELMLQPRGGVRVSGRHAELHVACDRRGVVGRPWKPAMTAAAVRRGRWKGRQEPGRRRIRSGRAAWRMPTRGWSRGVTARDLDGQVPGHACRAPGHPGVSSVSSAGLWGGHVRACLFGSRYA